MKNTNIAFSKLSSGLILLGTLVGLFVGCTSPSDNPEVLAWSDLGTVTQVDLDAYILSRPEEQQRPRDDQDQAEWRRAHLMGLITREAVMKKAADASVSEDPEVTSTLEGTRDRVLAELFTSELADSMPDPSEDDLRAFFESHKGEFGHSEQIRLRNIFIRVDRDAEQLHRNQKRAETQVLLDQIRSGARFEDLARTHSDSETARQGGLIGRLDRGQLDPSVERMVWNLKEGEVSEIVETPVGFHIFKVETHVAPVESSYEEVREPLQQRLHDEEKQRLVTVTFENLLATSDSIYQPDLLDSDDQLRVEDVLFRIDDRAITAADVARHRKNSSFAAIRYQPVRKWLEERAKDQLFAWKAEQLGFDQRPEIQVQLEKERAQIVVNRELANRLSEELDRLQEIGTLDTFYEENAARFQTPVMHNLQIITLKLSDFDPPFEAFELLQSLASDVRSGRSDFSNEARKVSTDPSAHRGGDLGWMPLTSFGVWAGPRAQKAVAQLTDDQVSNPFLLERYVPDQLKYIREAYALVRVKEIRPSTLPSFEDALQQVRSAYLSQNRAELEKVVQEELLETLHITILEGRL